VSPICYTIAWAGAPKKNAMELHILQLESMLTIASNSRHDVYPFDLVMNHDCLV